MLDNEDSDGDEEIKVILVGEMGTGKTSLINSAIGLAFQEKLNSTTTSSIVNKKMELKGKKYSINLWDTIGQEKYRALTKIFMKGAKIVIFVYDITSRHTFTELNFWFESTKEIINDNIVMGIIGNKSDLFLKEEVKEEEGRQLAKEKGYDFIQTSAKNATIFCEFLEKLVKKYLGLENEEEEDKSTKLKPRNNKEHKKRRWC